MDVSIASKCYQISNPIDMLYVSLRLVTLIKSNKFPVSIYVAFYTLKYPV